MPAVEWKDSYAIQVQDFDEHHKRFFAIINAVYDDYHGGSDPECVARVLNELLDYAKYHFTAEEEWMMSVMYPDIATHLTEHTVFIDKIFQMAGDYEAGNHDIIDDLVTFAGTWITKHILKSDTAYSAYAKTEE